VRKHLHDAPPRLADLRPNVELGDLEQVVARALAKSPADRYASAEEMSAAIEQAAPRPMPQAIPRRIPTPISTPMATPSGWNVPGSDPTAIPTVSSGPVVAPDPAAPNATMNIPPTRMHTARRFTPRQIVIGSGGLGLLLIIVVATLHTSGGAAPPPVHPVIVAPAPIDAMPVDPIAPVLARIADLYSNGDVEPALSLATKARRQYPDSAQLAFLEGKIYFAKLWWTDGIKALRDAIRLDPGYRRDPELIKLAIRAFLTTPDRDPELAELLHSDIGDAARPVLEDVAKTNSNAALRARASTELKRFP
jgi:hypothetical protein